VAEDSRQHDLGVLYMTVGHMVIMWALAEHALDQCIAVVFHACGGKHIDDRIPVSLKRKVKFLRRAFNQLPLLVPRREGALKLLARVTEIAPRRNELVHGALTNVIANDSKFRFAALDYTPHLHRVRAVELDLNNVPSLNHQVIELAADVAAFVRALADDHVVQRKSGA